VAVYSTGKLTTNVAPWPGLPGTVMVLPWDRFDGLLAYLPPQLSLNQDYGFQSRSAPRRLKRLGGVVRIVLGDLCSGTREGNESG